MSSKLILNTLALALATMGAGSAVAADLYGGGATFPAVPYAGDDYLNFSPNARLSTNAANCLRNPGYTCASLAWSGGTSAFQALSPTHKVSYCQTGSGFGKTMLNKTGTNVVSSPCGDFGGLPAAAGFATPAAVTEPDFIGTDAPYSSADYNAFRTNNAAFYASKQGITQIPALAGAIGLTYDDNGTSSMALTSAQVCSIFNKSVTNWSGITGSGLSGTIKVVYRSDNSGTSFAFTSWLFNNCSGMPVGFAPNQSFATAYAGGLGAGWVGVSGNNNVVATARPAGGLGLGYADFGEIANQGAKSALVNTFNPANFGTAGALALAGTDLVRGSVLDGSTLNPISGLTPNPPAVPPSAIANCMFVIKPNATISGRYPIVAFTYINTYSRANGQPAAVKALINKFVNNKSGTLPLGFAYVDGTPAHATLINNAVNGATNNCIQ